MGITTFQIVFDRPSDTIYTPGQQVSGRLCATLETSKNLRGITITVKGQAEVHWEETSSSTDSEGRDTSTTTNYDATEPYFEQTFLVYGGKRKGGETTQLEVGEYSFPFCAILPPVLPSSCEGPHGRIRYSVKAVFDRSWKKNKEALAYFTVVTPMDLNLFPQVASPVRLREEKTFWSCCCTDNGPLTFEVSLPWSGYVCGQEIPVTIDVENRSRKAVRMISCRFHLKRKYQATNGTKHTSEKLKELSFGSVGVHKSDTFSTQMIVPPVQPTMINCTIMELWYELEIIGHVTGLHKNITVCTPITVGTFPLKPS